MQILKRLLSFLMTKLKTEEPDFFINNRINLAPTRQSIPEPKREQVKPKKAQSKRAGTKMLTFSSEDFQQLQEDLTPLEKAIDGAVMFASNLQYSTMAWKTIETMQKQTDEFLSARYESPQSFEAAKLVRQQNIQSFLLVSALKQDLENVSA